VSAFTRCASPSGTPAIHPRPGHDILGQDHSRRSRMRTRSLKMQAAGLMLALTLLAACAPTSPSGGAAGSGAGNAPEARTARQERQRPLVMALREEPTMLSQRLDRDGLDHPFTVTLAFTDKDEAPRPLLAEKLPSQDDGSWVVNADGSMRTVWTLRPGARW